MKTKDVSCFGHINNRYEEYIKEVSRGDREREEENINSLRRVGKWLRTLKLIVVLPLSMVGESFWVNRHLRPGV